MNKQTAFKIGLYMITLTFYVQVQIGECNSVCNEPILLYEDLDCKPIFGFPRDCPSAFNCSRIENRSQLNEEKCYFHEKTYNPGENINDDETYGHCEVGCICEKKSPEHMGFTCAVLDCPEWLGDEPDPGCNFKYELDKCCNVGQACPPFNTTCEVNGEIYHDGQIFYDPNDKCTKCICEEGFGGKFAEPFCIKESCIQEVINQGKVNSFCAPSYISKDDCCPFSWICSENDIIIIATPPIENPDLKCKFGNQTLNIGDSFGRTHGEKGKLSCECRIPPYLTCIQNYDYPAYSLE